jgi:hypothetical protein
MAKASSSGGKSGKSGKSSGKKNRPEEGSANGEGAASSSRIPDALREAGQRAAELAQNPVARSMLAAGLVTAAAALTANQKVRDGAKRASRDAVDGAEAAADTANKIGAAMVSAATEAVRRLMNLDAPSSGTGAPESTAAQAPTDGGATGSKKGSSGDAGKAGVAGAPKSSTKSGDGKVAGAEADAAGSASPKSAGKSKSGAGGKKRASKGSSGGGSGASGS